MKKYPKYIIALITCAAMLGGCSGTARIDYADTYVAEQDSQENYIDYSNEFYYASSGENYYFTRNSFLYAINKQTQECHPLCNKSDCLHDQEETYALREKCSAFINPTDDKVVYNNGFIYYCIYDYDYDKDGIYRMADSICRLSVDTLMRETIYTTTDYAIYNFRVHRGYIYMEASAYVTDEGGGSRESSQGDAELLRVAIDSQDEAEVFVPYNKYRKKYKYFVVRETKLYGNHLFLKIGYTKNGKSQKTILNVNLGTKEIKDIGNNLPLDDASMLTIFNDKLVFNGNQTKIYECDFDGNNLKEVLDCSEIIGWYNRFDPRSNDGKTLFISIAYVNPEDSYDFTKSKNVIFCNEKYEYTVREMPIEYLADVGFDEDFFIYQKDKEDNDPIYLIDKNDLTMRKVYDFSDDE